MNLHLRFAKTIFAIALFALPVKGWAETASWNSGTLNSLSQGSVAPIQHFALIQDLMNKCVQQVEGKVPQKLDPFVVAKKAFEGGNCRIAKCFQFGMLVSILPMLASKDHLGNPIAAQAKQANAQQALVLAQSYSQSNSDCDNVQDDYPALPNITGYFGF